MNYSIILYILGCMLKFESAFLLLPFVIGLIYHEEAAFSYLIVAVFCILSGLVLTHKKPASST